MSIDYWVVLGWVVAIAAFSAWNHWIAFDEEPCDET